MNFDMNDFIIFTAWFNVVERESNSTLSTLKLDAVCRLSEVDNTLLILEAEAKDEALEYAEFFDVSVVLVRTAITDAD